MVGYVWKPPGGRRPVAAGHSKPDTLRPPPVRAARVCTWTGIASFRSRLAAIFGRPPTIPVARPSAQLSPEPRHERQRPHPPGHAASGGGGTTPAPCPRRQGSAPIGRGCHANPPLSPWLRWVGSECEAPASRSFRGDRYSAARLREGRPESVRRIRPGDGATCSPPESVPCRRASLRARRAIRRRKREGSCAPSPCLRRGRASGSCPADSTGRPVDARRQDRADPSRPDRQFATRPVRPVSTRAAAPPSGVRVFESEHLAARREQRPRVAPRQQVHQGSGLARGDGPAHDRGNSITNARMVRFDIRPASASPSAVSCAAASASLLCCWRCWQR